MKLELTIYDIANRLLEDEYANWSRAGAFALAEWLEELEESTGEEITFDVVAIRCDFSEYDDLETWASDHGIDCIDLGVEPDDDSETKQDAIREYIQDYGFLIEFNGGVIVSSF